jgi:hypothetical protein
LSGAAAELSDAYVLAAYFALGEDDDAALVSVTDSLNTVIERAGRIRVKAFPIPVTTDSTGAT